MRHKLALLAGMMVLALTGVVWADGGTFIYDPITRAQCAAATPCLWLSGALGFAATQTPVNGPTAIGTTAATVATMPAVAGKTNYLCGYTVDADATAATVGNMTITGLLSGTVTRRQAVGAVASATATTWHNYWPCQPASAVNTAIVITSAAAGAGGNTTVNFEGYVQ